MFGIVRHQVTRPFAIAAVVGLAAGGLVLLAQQKPLPPRTAADDGFKDTPMLPGLPWHVHDSSRPNPPVVTPGATPGAAPSDATVLFDGRDLSKWVQRGTGADVNVLRDPKWTVRDGYFETGARTGSLYSRDSFGDVQLHVEWAAPTVVAGNSQGRGNSGIFLMGLYEIQVLDSFENRSYADGQAGAIYGQWPPLANPARKPGEWQSYDIVFEAPRFDGQALKSPAYVTVFLNGVLMHNRKEIMGPTVHRALATYESQPAEDALVLQDHQQPVRYRNIWARRVPGYDVRR